MASIFLTLKTEGDVSNKTVSANILKPGTVELCTKVKLDLQLIFTSLKIQSLKNCTFVSYIPPRNVKKLHVWYKLIKYAFGCPFGASMGCPKNIASCF